MTHILPTCSPVTGTAAQSLSTARQVWARQPRPEQSWECWRAEDRPLKKKEKEEEEVEEEEKEEEKKEEKRHKERRKGERERKRKGKGREGKKREKETRLSRPNSLF